MKKNADILIVNASQILTMDPDLANCDEKDSEALKLGVIENGAVAVRDGLITGVGPTKQIMAEFEGERVIDAKGSILTPGLVDPHTHIVFAGSRHLEFDMRMRGSTYHEILEAGGGIHSTVRATRKASLDELVALALPRLKKLMEYGVTTVEVKSGYGLDAETEIKMLEAIKKLASSQPLRLVPTFLGAHVIPTEFKDNRGAYIDLVVNEMIPEIASRGLAKACDVFLDEGAYEIEEATRILEAAKAAGLALRIHAGQFTDKHGPELMANLGGLSADHLEQVSDEGIEAMARGSVVAVLLPGAAFSLRDHFPDGRRFIDAGVDVAVATDDNPGTSRTENLPLMAQMAVTQMGLTPREAWCAITINGAKALGLEDQIGSITPKKSADLTIFTVSDFRIPLYYFGQNHASVVIAAGKVVME